MLSVFCIIEEEVQYISHPHRHLLLAHSWIDNVCLHYFAQHDHRWWSWQFIQWELSLVSLNHISTTMHCPAPWEGGRDNISMCGTSIISIKSICCANLIPHIMKFKIVGSKILPSYFNCCHPWLFEIRWPFLLSKIFL
jgi:hypothetical protein